MSSFPDYSQLFDFPLKSKISLLGEILLFESDLSPVILMPLECPEMEFEGIYRSYVLFEWNSRA